jgi:predicted anti-sigma-YlaC factor YlaD
MSCDDFKLLMMGLLDGEITPAERRRLEEHLEDCPACARELEEFRRLKGVTDRMKFVGPDDEVWERYWTHVYNRLERGVAWILTSLGAILLLAYAGFRFIDQFVQDPEVSLLLRIAVAALLLGLIILFVSVARERLFMWRKDKYRGVIR